MESESKKGKSSFSTLLIVGPIIVLPFMLFSDSNNVFWNESVTSITYQIKTKPKIISLDKGRKEVRFYELNKERYYVINYGSYELLEDNDEYYKIVTTLNAGDSLTISVPESTQNDKRIRIVGLKFKNTVAFTPVLVSQHEKRDFYSRTFGFVIALLIGILIKLISFIKAKRK